MKKIKHILITLIIIIPIGWFSGQLIAIGLIKLLQNLGLDDNLYCFLDSISLI